MTATLSLPLARAATYDSAGFSSNYESSNTIPKFPHTRAQLSAIARQYKALDRDSYDSDADGDEFSRVSASLVNKVAALLDSEQEDELKTVLKNTFNIDNGTLEQHVLDLMHKHRDDVAGVPFLFLTPTRRPISRPSSRASTHSGRLYPARPDTPASAPTSPLAQIFRRPHTPMTSPLASNAAPPAFMTSKSEYSVSPQSSPVLSHAQTAQTQVQFTASLPASPLSSPRLLNAKASEFKPIQRPLSAAPTAPSAHLLRTDTPPPDLWALNSPRVTSNLAIAAPLIAEQSPSPLPLSVTLSSSLRTSLIPDEEEDDSFDPFTSNNPAPPFPSITDADFDNLPWPHQYPAYAFPDAKDDFRENSDLLAADQSNVLTDGMTPFDVLSSVFGSTLAPSELEDALATNGYDFERAMAWLVDGSLPSASQPSPPQQIRMQPAGGRITLVSGVRGAPRGSFHNGGGLLPRYGNGNNNNGIGRGRPAPNGNRVCRYFLAGECLRADCRFSHDLERALCRFWLRGTCAKHESCEFLHHLPKDTDVSSLNFAMSRANIQPNNGPHPVHSQVSEEFPALGFDSIRGRRGGFAARVYDPSRTRFAAAVKKSPPAGPLAPAASPSDAHNPARREAMGSAADNIHHHSAIVAPRPSPRLKLRPPQLLPTLPTGEAISNLYMSYRSRALQLGAARNACLSRAADAWRRGDGAAAKRFSREGHEMNAKMAVEMAQAAARLVRERAKVAEQVVRGREPSWSDDPGDRATRGSTCGGGYGIVLGIAGRDVGDGNLSADERKEGMLDLHGLHANEATEVLEQFLLALENEHFYGLAYALVGEEKHTGTQDVGRGASRARLATGVREWLHRWGYPWSECEGIICIDPLTHVSE